MQNSEKSVRNHIKFAKRIVIKIGTNTIRHAEHAGVDEQFLSSIAQQVFALKNEGRSVLIVSSGAIGMGSLVLHLNQRSQSVAVQQACASIGQPLLMQSYRNAFSQYDIITAQILLTRHQFDHRKSFNNLKTTVEKLLKLGIVPIINENDSVSTEEIGQNFGDNDHLSAFVASKINADLLIILSDVDGLYDSDPRVRVHAKKISYIEKLKAEHFQSAGRSGSSFARGGMTSKLEAVGIAAEAGCPVVLANGRSEQVVCATLRAEAVGTLFSASEQPIRNRSRWIKNATAQGSITVDKGAMDAIMARGSLLAKGITNIQGVFNRGDVVLVNDKIKLISALDSSELNTIKGKHSTEVRSILGEDSPDIIARPEDMVIL